ncbi:MAG: hypothetical protein ACI8ZM_003677 [Crocinitomix sp.]|jgi:hypothetical protein
MLKLTKQFFLFACILSILSSCFVQQTTVGDVSDKTKTEKYSKSKQFYLFWGLIPLGKNEPRAPEDDYVVESKFKLGDFIISAVTGGIVSARSSVVYVAKE